MPGTGSAREGSQHITVKGKLPEQVQQRYISYLLRLWHTRSKRELVWRASLESAQTGERRGFANLTDLLTFLEQETNHAAMRQTAPDADDKEGDPHG